jgi:hypothetical protein
MKIIKPLPDQYDMYVYTHIFTSYFIVVFLKYSTWAIHIFIAVKQ